MPPGARSHSLRSATRRTAAASECAGTTLAKSEKFMLGPAEPCTLRFGPDDRSLNEMQRFEACLIPGPADMSRPPTLAKACWAWCDGTMSQAKAHASLLSIRAPS